MGQMGKGRSWGVFLQGFGQPDGVALAGGLADPPQVDGAKDGSHFRREGGAASLIGAGGIRKAAIGREHGNLAGGQARPRKGGCLCL